MSAGLNPGLPDPSAERLRRAFRLLNRFMLAMWHLGMGRWINIWPGGIGRIMVLTHIGRRTGLARQTPVNYARSRVRCTAFLATVHSLTGTATSRPIHMSRPGFPRAAGPVWPRNCPSTMLDFHGFVRFSLPAALPHPLFEGIRPRTISDDQLRALAADYRLLHIRRLEATAAED